MGKTVKLFLVWLTLVATLWANSIHQKQIEQFDKEFTRANSEELLKLHHMLKNVYIQSIIQNNSELKIDALKRLVKSSSSLRLDASPYERELQTLGVSSLTKPSELAKVPSVAPIIPPRPTPSKAKTTPPASSSTPLAALSVRFDEGDVTLRFNRPVGEKEIKSFLLKASKTHRYVFDLPGALMGSSRTHESKSVDQIRVAQYDKNTIRVVFSHAQPLTLHFRTQDEHVFIGLSQKSGSQSATTKPYAQAKPTPPARRFDPAKKTVVIDPGHGGRDGGAVNGKYVEKVAVLDISLKLGKELQKRGYKVHYTRSKDTHIQLRNRTRIANDKNADLFISVHANAAPSKDKHASMHGVETFFLSPARSERSKNVAALENQSDIEEMNHFSKQTYLNFLNREKIVASNKFALDVQQGMLDSLKKQRFTVRDGGVREAPFWVLVGAQMPAILLEVGYITNPEEAKRIFDASYQEAIAQGAANGVDAYFNKNN
ncbi:MAG: N-acetylmuramoyl-L-alanine amidase [Campylobacterales bacterium]|nr:N-acetylmuramoyl-L-alanine amidase [Campylobacterales bacterium]